MPVRSTAESTREGGGKDARRTRKMDTVNFYLLDQSLHLYPSNGVQAM